jgi:hypothetical protein
MKRAPVMLKRGAIIALVITIIGGVAAPVNTAYAFNGSRSVLNAGSYRHKGSTGHVTNIDIEEKKWEYNTPQYIITELELPLNYINPWYTDDDDPDPAKNVKTYYYLGTVIYNDTDIKDTAHNYASLSEDEKKIYDELKYYYELKLKTSSVYNAKVNIVSRGTKLKSDELPLIYELLTGEKFDWLYWYNEGVGIGVENYSDYGKGTIGTGKISHGTKSNYAKAVSITGYDSKIVKTYKVVKNGEARVYVKGKKQGTTTLTIKTTLNDGKTVTYKTKVIIKAENAPIKYRTDVNPLSYAAYTLEKDGGNWLGYVCKDGDFYGQVSGLRSKVFQIYSHPILFKEYGISYSKGGDDRGKLNDDSQYMRDFLKDCGAIEMLAAGKSELEVYLYVTDRIFETSIANIDNDNLPQKGRPGNHQSLQGLIEGAECVCEDNAAIATGIANFLGFNWYCKYFWPGIVSREGHVEAIVVLDGDHYYAGPFGLSGYAYINNQGPTITYPDLKMSHKSIADVKLEELMNRKISFDVYDPYEEAGLYYKISDKYEAGRFRYGATINDKYDWRDAEPITTGTAVIDYNYDLLVQGLGSNFVGDTRLITLRTGENPSWNKDEQNTVTFRYAVPYMERAYFTMKKGSAKQLNLVNSDWSDWTVKSSNSKIATVNSTGKVSMKGKGTATITLTHKTISDLSIKVLVSTGSIDAETAREKAGTFYTRDIYAENGLLPDDHTGSILAGDYMRIYE